MGSAGWQPVTAESPCYACGKPDWCSVSADGKKAVCRREGNGSGVRKVDRSGQEYWLYEPNGHGEARSPEDEPHERYHEAPEKADPETLDRVYGALLGELTLSRHHERDLHRRGLSADHIERGGYQTLPKSGREELARRLVYRFGSEVCSRVPGLHEKEAGTWSVAGASGLLVPVRDAEGRIGALKVRSDGAEKGSRYTYLSSKNRGGPGPGSQAHVPLHAGPGHGVVRLTEGELKADVATALDEILTVSTPARSASTASNATPWPRLMTRSPPSGRA